MLSTPTLFNPNEPEHDNLKDHADVDDAAKDDNDDDDDDNDDDDCEDNALPNYAYK